MAKQAFRAATLVVAVLTHTLIGDAAAVDIATVAKTGDPAPAARSLTSSIHPM